MNEVVERIEKCLPDLLTAQTVDGGVWVDYSDLRMLLDHIQHLEALKLEYMDTFQEWDNHSRVLADQRDEYRKMVKDMQNVIDCAIELAIKRTTPCITKLEGALTEYNPMWRGPKVG